MRLNNKSGLKYSAALFLLAFTIGFFSCNSKESTPRNFDYGAVEEGVYSNNFFEFTLKIPENRHVLSSEANQNLMDGDTAVLKQSSNISSATLLTVLKYPLENTPDSVFNANIMIIAENLKANKRVNNGADYLMLTRKVLEQIAGKREFPDKVLRTIEMGGTEFAEMNVINDDSGIIYNQQYLSTLSRDFALTIIKTYADEIQKAELDAILNTLSFEK